MKTEYEGILLIQWSDFVVVPLSIVISYQIVLYITKTLFLPEKKTIIASIKTAFWVKMIYTGVFLTLIFTFYADRNDQMMFYWNLQNTLYSIKKSPSLFFYDFTFIQWGDVT